MKKDGNFFYKLKKLEKKQNKIMFVKFEPKRSTPKWSSNKMSNAEKDHNKAGCAKKTCFLAHWTTHFLFTDDHPLEKVVKLMQYWE